MSKKKSNGEKFMTNISYVYFVKCNVSGKVKIGKAIDIEKRINTIELCNFTGVTLIYSIEISDDLFHSMETLVHKHFADKRIKREWFDINKEDIIDFIKNKLTSIIIPIYIYSFEKKILSSRYDFIDYKRIPNLVKSNFMLKYSNKKASWSLEDSFMKKRSALKDHNFIYN